MRYCTQNLDLHCAVISSLCSIFDILSELAKRGVLEEKEDHA